MTQDVNDGRWALGTGPTGLRTAQVRRWITVLTGAHRAAARRAGGGLLTAVDQQAVLGCVAALHQALPTLEFLEGTGRVPSHPCGGAMFLSGALRGAGLCALAGGGCSDSQGAARLIEELERLGQGAAMAPGLQFTIRRMAERGAAVLATGRSDGNLDTQAA